MSATIPGKFVTDYRLHPEYGIPAFILVETTGTPYIFFMEGRFDSTKDVANQKKHNLSLAFGDKIFEDDDHLIIPSIRPADGEERFKVVGSVGGKLFTGVFVWRNNLPRFISVRRSNKGEERAYHSAC